MPDEVPIYGVRFLTMREEFLATMRELRAQVPRERAFLVLETLNEIHPDPDVRLQLRELTDQMRRKKR